MIDFVKRGWPAIKPGRAGKGNTHALDDIGRIPVLSFFTGGGLMDIGFEMAGFRIVWTNEHNPMFADIYGHAFSEWRRDGGRGNPIQISSEKSIASLQAREVVHSAFPDGRPKIFGVIGGPPCPDFSRGGKKKGFNGTSGRLTRTYVNLVEKVKPAFFVLENVPGLVRYKKPRNVFQRLLNRLAQKGGYFVDHRVLNALDYGVPQDRERLFVIGFRKELFKGQEVKVRNWCFSWPVDLKFANAKSLSWPTTARFGGRPELPKELIPELTAGFVFSKPPNPATLPNGKDIFIPKSPKFKKIREGDVSGMSFKRLHRHRYSPTAWYGNNEVHLHPWEPRRLSVREVLRLQTVPDSYALPDYVPLSAKFKIISNGVPCLMAKRVAESIASLLSETVLRRR